MGAVSFNLFVSSSSDCEVSALELANIEALSEDESSIEPGDACYSDWEYDAEKPKAVVCGTPCKYEYANINFFQTTSYCK